VSCFLTVHQHVNGHLHHNMVNTITAVQIANKLGKCVK